LAILTVHCENKKKLFCYQKLLEHVDNTDHFVPFVFEATSRLGPTFSKKIPEQGIERGEEEEREADLTFTTSRPLLVMALYP
jgi:hypothetical protein